MTIIKRSRTKNNHNQAFKDNERIIQKEFTKLNYLRNGYISVRKIAEKTGLTRQTIYNHHPDIADTINQSENFLFDEFYAALNNPDEKIIKTIPDENKRIFYITMMLMREYKEVFEIMCTDYNNQGLLYRMLREMCPRLQINWPRGSQALDVASERVCMFITMMVEVLSQWGVTTKCDVSKADYYIGRMNRIITMLAENRLP